MEKSRQLQKIKDVGKHTKNAGLKPVCHFKKMKIDIDDLKDQLGDTICNTIRDVLDPLDDGEFKSQIICEVLREIIEYHENGG